MLSHEVEPLMSSAIEPLMSSASASFAAEDDAEVAAEVTADIALAAADAMGEQMMGRNHHRLDEGAPEVEVAPPPAPEVVSPEDALATDD